jgi:hypothetical protein
MGFQVNPEVISKIRPMTRRDIIRIAHLHYLAMGNSLWAKLGERFLREIYRGLLSNQYFLGFVYVESGQIEGFIAGSTDTSAMMRGVFITRAPRLTIAALLGLRDPTVAKQLLQTLRYFSQSSQELENNVSAESLFCSFTPKLRGKRISGHINKVLFDTLYAKGHQQVKITTETDNNGANRQLQRWGFTNKGTFQFYNKEMVTYILDFDQSDRVQPKIWFP